MIEAGSGTPAPTIFTVPDVLVSEVAESSVPVLKSKLSKRVACVKSRQTHHFPSHRKRPTTAKRLVRHRRLDAPYYATPAADASTGLRPQVADQPHFGEAHIALCLRKSAETCWSCPALSSASTALAVKVEGVAKLSIFTPLLVSRATNRRRAGRRRCRRGDGRRRRASAMP